MHEYGIQFDLWKNDWLYAPVGSVNRWKLKHFRPHKVLTVESWNTLWDLGVNDYDFLPLE
jgi:hypothetical protein